MRIAIISDLHLGSATGEDVARDPDIRRVLLEEIAAADRLVLLGDTLELRELPLSLALAGARSFFEEVGDVMAGRDVVLVPGNHDHRLAGPLIESVALAGGPLGLEHRSPAAGDAGGRIAAWLGETELSIAYPGLWLRADVYATHGHYMDCHMSVPRLECVAAATMMRAGGPLPDPATPEDYERMVGPIYGLAFGLAQADMTRGAARASEHAWRALAGRRREASGFGGAARKAATGAGVSAGIRLLNRLLRSGFDSDLSAPAIARTGIHAGMELARRLDIGGSHLITGHTHRGGPYENDAEWQLPGGGRLHNTGSWVFASAFHHPGTPPGSFWPGTVTWLEDDGPPRRERLLLERSREELQGTVDRIAAPAA